MKTTPTPIPAAWIRLLAVCGLFGLAWLAPGAWGQVLDPDDAALLDRAISDVQFEGLSRVPPQTVFNNIRTAPGNRYDPRTINGDVDNLRRTGNFKTIDVVAVLQQDGSVVIIFRFVEQPLLIDVQVVGNHVIPDRQILESIPLAPGLVRSEDLIDRSRRLITALYRAKGHYLVEVKVVERQELEDNGILLLEVIEGPRVKVRVIEFRGNEAFDEAQLHPEIKTSAATFLFDSGRLDQDVLTDDVAAIDRFYKERGYLDVRVDREIEISPNSREVKVIFLIAEGQQFILRNIDVQYLRGGVAPADTGQFSPEEIAALIVLKTGDVYSEDKLRSSLRVLRETYGGMGYYDADVVAIDNRIGGAQPEVDLILQITEGTTVMVGNVDIVGNTLTKDKVIRRELDFRPGRPLSTRDIQLSQEALRDRRLFGSATITVQDPDPRDPAYRDILVEIDETNTGAVTFGVAVGSDDGVFGDISLRQRNFDIADFPETWGEFVKGRAFRGAGQTFALSLQPGANVSQFSASLTEPYLFETPNSLTIAGLVRDRVFSDYDEERRRFSLALGRRLGDVWNIAVSTRFEHVELSDIDDDAPVAVFDSAGPDNITGVGLSITRNTTTTRIRPGSGSVLELAFEQVGALGGDLDFFRASAEYTVFITMNEDFLGRKSILRLNGRVSRLFDADDAPVYERLYLGGQSFRGFDFRTVSPKGIRADNGEPSDDPVGGQWLLFASAQYEVPLYEEIFNGVIFIDTGTVTKDVGIDEWRLSAGVGIRLSVPQLGPVPIALDFAVPILKESTDEDQIFVFSVDIPF